MESMPYCFIGVFRRFYIAASNVISCVEVMERLGVITWHGTIDCFLHQKPIYIVKILIWFGYSMELEDTQEY